MYNVKVFTVDSMQGRENYCIIFDLVLAFERNGKIGCLETLHRLNVALSRAIKNFWFIGDVNTLNTNDKRLNQLENMTKEEREAAKTADTDNNNYLRQVYTHYIAKSIVKTVNPELYHEELQYIDMGEAEECSAQQSNRACRTSRKLGHILDECTEPRPFSGIYFKCGKKRHRREECRETICPKCKKEGHSEVDCKGAETRCY